jgi:hypothetical protein
MDPNKSHGITTLLNKLLEKEIKLFPFIEKRYPLIAKNNGIFTGLVNANKDSSPWRQ